MAGKPRYQVVPAGRAESPLKDRSQAPRQGNLGAPPTWLLFEPEVTEGIRDLRAGTEIMVLTWLDRSRRDVLVTRPGDNPHSPPAGVFSTRPPGRPNPIGLHRVRDHGRRITGSRARPGSARWDAACRCENRYWTKPPDDSDIAGHPVSVSVQRILAGLHARQGQPSRSGLQVPRWQERRPRFETWPPMPSGTCRGRDRTDCPPDETRHHAGDLRAPSPSGPHSGRSGAGRTGSRPSEDRTRTPAS
jgi:hypothetical protein